MAAPASPPDIAKVTEALAELKKLETRAAAFNELARQVNAEEAACLKEIGKCKKLLKELQATRKAEAAANASPKSRLKIAIPNGKPGSAEVIAQLWDEKLELIRRKIQHLEFQFPKPAHIILRLALGSYAPVSLKPLQLRLQYKQEYEIFKLRFSLIFLAFSVLGLGVIRNRAFDAIFGFAILYYYCTCILREHILLVNGSRIRSWWFGHHYLSIILSGVLLIWPSTPAYRSFRTPFFAFAGFMQVMQYLQYRYQRSRLYVLVTLDRARPMDTVAGDGFFSASMEREFFLLVPFLVIGQLWQLYNAYILYVFWHTSEGQEGWQGLAAAILFAILGVGNTVTTLRTWRAKKKGASLPSSLMPGSPPITSPLASPTSPTSSAPLNGNGSVAPSAPQPATAAQEEYPFPAVKSQHKPNISKLSER